jgi:hypothetical protein
MVAPREIEDSLESVLGIYFSDVRHRARAAFILCDELVEMTCKVRAREVNHQFNMNVGFHTAWMDPNVGLDPNGLGARIQASRNTRNTLQHASAAATVDDQHCADAIMDAVDVIEHCWPGSAAARRSWMRCALRVIWLYSSNGGGGMRGVFEDKMRDGSWRVDARKPRINEIIIQVGRRQFWQILLTQAPSQIDEVLDVFGVP